MPWGPGRVPEGCWALGRAGLARAGALLAVPPPLEGPCSSDSDQRFLCWQAVSLAPSLVLCVPLGLSLFRVWFSLHLLDASKLSARAR